jgi:hypothetical protein
VIDQETFDKAVMHNPRLLEAWNGSATLGTNFVLATQRNNSLSGGFSFLRVTPQESWLDRVSRTSINFNFALGTLKQPDTDDVRTEIYHLDGERDRYISSRAFVFLQGAFDHNFSQGLDLQQSYGAGFGWTVIQNPIHELNLKASLNYVKQQFQDATLNQNLLGSAFAETYNRKFAHNLVLNEQASITPAWNNLNAYSAAAQIGLSIPVYKLLSVSLTGVDTFINNPSSGFKKNSFQFTTGMTLALK